MTPNKTLSGISHTIDMYLNEAEWCANHTYEKNSEAVLGLAAMTLSLACVVSIGEALFRRTKGLYDPKRHVSDEDSIEAFCNEIKIYDWLLSPTGKPTKQKPHEILTSTRNALIHALSLPNTICLVPKAKEYHVHYSSKYEIGIVPSLFVTAIKRTVDELIHREPSLRFDDWFTTKNRAPVKIDMTASVSSTPK